MEHKGGDKMARSIHSMGTFIYIFVRERSGHKSKLGLFTEFSIMCFWTRVGYGLWILKKWSCNGLLYVDLDFREESPFLKVLSWHSFCFSVLWLLWELITLRLISHVYPYSFSVECFATALSCFRISPIFLPGFCSLPSHSGSIRLIQSRNPEDVYLYHVNTLKRRSLM